LLTSLRSTTSAATQPASDLFSYRCHTRPYDQACNMDSSLDGFIQIKAVNADKAWNAAQLVVPPKTIILEVERLDG
jgi:hypothetical protein